MSCWLSPALCLRPRLLSPRLKRLGKLYRLNRPPFPLPAASHQLSLQGDKSGSGPNCLTGTSVCPLRQQRPSADGHQQFRDKLRVRTGRDHLAMPTPTVITAVNRVVRGWAGYFHFQHCTRDFSVLRWFIEARVRTYLRRTHRHLTRAYQAVPSPALYGRLGLYRLPTRAPWTTRTHSLR